MRAMPPKSRIPEGTGPRVKARRQELGLTQKKVARAVAEKVDRDYGESWLAQIERDKGGMLLDAALALADVLGMSLDVMFGRRAYIATDATRGPDVVIEGDDTAAAVEIKQRLTDGAVDPLLAAEQAPDSASPIPLKPRQRGRAGAASRPRKP